MISIREIRALASEWGISMTTVEKDYVLNWILHIIGSDPEMRDQWVFTGGTCVKKCYAETWRFSSQLEFAIRENFPKDEQALSSRLQHILSRIGAESNIEFSLPTSLWALSPDATFAQGRITFRSITANRPLLSIPFLLTKGDTVADKSVMRPVSHAFAESMPATVTLRAESLPGLFAERITRITQPSASALYDTVHLFWRIQDATDSADIRAYLSEQLETTILTQSIATVEDRWAAELQDEFWKVPPFTHFRDALPHVFAWLRGEEPSHKTSVFALEPDIDYSWQPPATIAYWGFGIPLEHIRFAATNHLCIQLQYGGTKRLIEPYALRLTLDGNLILAARRADTGNPRSYRVDRMESVWITDIPFEPVYPVEMGSISPIRILPTVRDQKRVASSR